MVESVGTRRAFSALSDSHVRGRSGPVWVVRADDPDRDGTAPTVHAAYAIGKAVGGAVVRNRIRRRLRAAMAELERREVVVPGLYLVGMKPSGAEESFAGLSSHLERAVSALR